MSVFTSANFRGHEEVAFCHDPDVGLKAIIAIHDRTLGPALGGLRIWDYASDDEALEDVLRLSRGMTYKAALAGLNFGGGKAVIIADAKTAKSEALLRRFGAFVETLGGRYITAEDVGSSPRDLEVVRQATRHVAGIAEGGSGDPSPATAWGVFHGLRSAVRHRLGRDDLTGLAIAVQGLGHVGQDLMRHLSEAGARLIVTDIDDARIAEARDKFGATAVGCDEIYAAAADVFAPCALGAVLNDETIPQLHASVVAGSANNQLAEDRHGAMLAKRDILYAPDYVINAGGIINISHEGRAYSQKAAFAHCAQIYDTLAELFARADRTGEPTSTAADTLAEERIAAARARAPRPALRKAS